MIPIRSLVWPAPALLALLLTDVAFAQADAGAPSSDDPALEAGGQALPTPIATPVSIEPAPATSDSELEALRERVQLLEEERQAELRALADDDDQKFKIYGFLDVGLRKLFPAEDPLLKGLMERKLTFVLGNINLYLDAQPTPNWRALIETRLTTYPHGTETVAASGEFLRTDTRVSDTNSSSGRNKVIWGGVVLERAQIEHTVTDLFNVRVGYFLTPYGIWNVDHGTPTLISLVLPAFQVEEALPARQLGVQAYGGTTFDDTELGYAAYISNGRAPYLEDPSDTKAFGLRLQAGLIGLTTQLRLGASAYLGDSLETKKTLTVGTEGAGIDISTKYEYEEWGVGADVSLDVAGLRVRTEGLIHNVQYEGGKHEPVTFGQPGRTRPNRYEYYWYAIVAYRWRALEPYLYSELKHATPRDGFADVTYLPGLGLNLHFSPYAQLKTQWVSATFFRTDGTDVSDYQFNVVDSRFVLSF